MHSIPLEEALTQFVEDAGMHLHAEIAGGAEVSFALDSQGSRRGSPSRRASAARSGGPTFYSYRALTDEFIADRSALLRALPSHEPAVRALSAFEGLDRYLVAAGIEPGRAHTQARAASALRVLLSEVFADQSDFELAPERLHAAIARLQEAALAGAGGVTIVATLHGLTIASAELALTGGLRIAHPESLAGLPTAAGEAIGQDHLIAILNSEDEEDPDGLIARGGAVLKDLLRSLRLFGDGRVTLGPLAWARVGSGGWNALALGSGGRPHGMLVVTAEHEDELRAFCNLVSRRAPEGNELAWALRRFELGCERASAYEGLTDHLLALRSLLEPDGPASGLLAGRLAALCATPEHRLALTERMLRALELEHEVIAGTAVEHAGGWALAADVADYLRALLRDVVCGHLEADLVGLADQILLELQPPPEAEQPSLFASTAPRGADGRPLEGEISAEQVLGDLGESEEILDLLI